MNGRIGAIQSQTLDVARESPEFYWHDALYARALPLSVSVWGIYMEGFRKILHGGVPKNSLWRGFKNSLLHKGLYIDASSDAAR